MKETKLELYLSILDKIRDEIADHCGLIKEDHCKYCSYCNSVMGVREILEIIDKYKKTSMVSDYTTLKNKPQIVGVSLKNTEEMISCADMLDVIGHGTTYTTDELQKIIKGLPTFNLNTERGSL